MNLLSYIPPFIALLFVLAGIPAFQILYKATEDLNRSIILTIIYELVVIIISFLTKVWQRLETRWSERLADVIDISLRSMFSGYRRRYLEYIIYQHRVFDVKGLNTQGPYNLELEKVYVQLGVDPTPLHEINTNPIKILPNVLRFGSHPIWEYLNDKSIHETNYVILGPPGSGKTTLLKHMALTLAAPSRRRNKVGAPKLLPILLFIRDHAKSIMENPNRLLVELIRDQFADRQAPIPPVGWLEKNIEKGACLIMLDGLDEVADVNIRRQIIIWVEKCMSSYGKNRFIITSRPFGYRTNPLSCATVLQVRPFTRLQVEKFVHNWYLANEVMSFQRNDPGVIEDARRGAEDLLERLHSSSTLAELAVNPLLLTMIATVHRYRSSLPERRVELYAEICEVFLGKRQEARGLILDLTPGQKICILHQLAYHLMEREESEISEEDALQVVKKSLFAVNPHATGGQFLRDIENSSGLLVELGSGRYSFSHKTFQEYLASLHVKESGCELELRKQIINPWWHETIRLYCAQKDASPIITACLNSRSVTALSLAIACMAEAREVDFETREQYNEIMEKGLEDPDLERRNIIASAYLERRIRQ